MYKGLANKEGIKEPVIDNKIRGAWNEYVKYLDGKGLKGHASLDKDDFGGKMIDEYVKANPNSPINRDMIVPIQKEFQNYRKFRLDQIKSGVLKFDEGVDENNFMRALSIVDGIPGQRTTSFSFPEDYMKTYNEKDELLEKENKGYKGVNGKEEVEVAKNKK